MQKAAQRVKAAERIARARIRRRTEIKQKDEAWERRGQRKLRAQENSRNIVQERVNRRVDWETGPLAPRRDVGEKAETYGAYSIYSARPTEKQPKHRLNWWHLAEGDRVVLIRGRERGKIAEITDIDEESNTVILRDTNNIDITVPQWLQEETQSSRKLISRAHNIPVEDVRLVFPLPDPETGKPRDVVIDRLERVSALVEGRSQRCIPGTNTVIPWPAQAEEVFKTYDDDTERINVEEKTFRPYLLHPPMPMSVIDELRNKYSSFRTRHEYEYIEKLEASDARIERRKHLGKTMQTPLQELAELRTKQRELKKTELTEAQLAKIGETMMKEQEMGQRETVKDQGLAA